MPTQAEAEAALTAPLKRGACLEHCNRALAYFNDAPGSGDLAVCQGICVNGATGKRYLHCWMERTQGAERTLIDLTQPRPFFSVADFYTRFSVTEIKRYGDLDLMTLMTEGITFWGFEGTDAVSVSAA